MIRKVLDGARSLLTGMGVTAREGSTKPVTQRYPHARPEMSEAYRSCIKLVRFPETGSHDCVACMQCVNICPSFCIAIDGEKIEGIKKQRAVRFEVDFALCSLCGLCVDVCPTVTLEYSKRFDDAGYTRHWVSDLLEPYRDGEAEFIEAQRAREAAAAAAKKAPEKAAKAATGDEEPVKAPKVAKVAKAPKDATAAEEGPATGSAPQAPKADDAVPPVAADAPAPGAAPGTAPGEGVAP